MKPKMKEDYEILKYKKLHELKIAKILKPHALQYIENWLSINDQEEYTGKIYLTIRDMYTIINNA